MHWLPEYSLRELMGFESVLRSAMVEWGNDESTIQHVLCFMRPIFQADIEMRKPIDTSRSTDAPVMQLNDRVEQMVLTFLSPLAKLVIENHRLSVG